MCGLYFGFLINRVYSEKGGMSSMALQPTNAGINYQQRIAAQYLGVMLADFPIESWLPGSKGVLEKMRFESSDEIDDLVLENDMGDVYYIQAKRTLSLSNQVDSQFYKVISQFVKEYLLDKGEGKYYLAVSSAAAGTIHNRLRRLLNNIRRNRDIDNLYLNKSDQEILDTFLTVVRLVYKNHTNKEMDSTTLLHLCECIYVVVHDVESGMSGEMACKILLSSLDALQCEALWNSLIVDSLDFATNRSIVTRSYIQDRYMGQLKQSGQTSFFSPMPEGEVQIGYDIVLGKSPQLLEFSRKESESEFSLMKIRWCCFNCIGLMSPEKKRFQNFTPIIV